jgi:haloacid dehalogenase-like hydrolase
MTGHETILPAWRPGPTRDAILGFLHDIDGVPPADRVACFDNDGTLWCERPTYVQLDFFVDALKAKVAADPSAAGTPEYTALLTGDHAAIAQLGLARIGLALVELFDGMTPEAFVAHAREFMRRAMHAGLDRPTRTTVYQPMLELLGELRRRDFAISVVTGGGTEFVRAISAELYDVPPEAVVGTLIKYALDRDGDGRPRLLRTTSILGDANEGPTKVTNIQTQLGRRPILAAGNSGGDREMLEWAGTANGPGLALLIDHDDPEREFQYLSSAETFTESEPITDVGRRLGWTIVSMANDWDTVFPPVGDEPVR